MAAQVHSFTDYHAWCSECSWQPDAFETRAQANTAARRHNARHHDPGIAEKDGNALVRPPTSHGIVPKDQQQ